MAYNIDSIMVWVGEDLHGMSNIIINTCYGDGENDGYTITTFNYDNKKVRLLFGKKVTMDVQVDGITEFKIKPDDISEGEFFENALGLDFNKFMDTVFYDVSSGPYYEALEDLNYDLVDGNSLCINTIYEYINGAQVTSLRYSVVDCFGTNGIEVVKFEDVKGLLSESDLEEITQYQLEIDEPEI